MNASGDAAEQVVRMSLEGAEVAAKITGQGAKLIAARIYVALKEEQKTKGKARLSSMLKSGKPLKVYEVRQQDLATFAKEAKRYGVLYCVLKDKDNKDANAMVDVIARVEDASKIQRITDRFQLVAMDTASVIGDIQKTREEAQRGVKERTTEDLERGKRIMKPIQKEDNAVNPTTARAANDPLSGPNSKQVSQSNGSAPEDKKPSVKEKLEGYRKENERKRTKKSRERDVLSERAAALDNTVPKHPKKPEKGR